MQAIITSVKTSGGDENKLRGAKSAAAAPVLDWSTMYTRKPAGSSSLFALEAMIAKRMELLAWIDQLLNSPNVKSFSVVLDEIGARLPLERRKHTTPQAAGHVVLGRDDAFAADDVERSRTPRRSASRSGNSTANGFIFEGDEDLFSHLLARFAFCMSEQWRKWFVKTEETLLRARLRLQMAKCELDFLPALMRDNGLPCEPLSEEQRQNPRLQEYVAFFAASQGKSEARNLNEFLSAPLMLATRLIKTRSVLCLQGQAILHREQAQEVFLTVFRSKLNRGLHEAYLARMRLASHGDDERETVMRMLDAFLECFVSDPMATMQEMGSGAIGAGDVRRLAHTHFPLCMRQVDEHLRREGHLKHHGRFTYGLFLKAIGLSLQDSMTLFASLMTLKCGNSGVGNVEAFSKTSYGYNVRHNYGMEGKKTSYNSMSCATLLALPPVVDRFDCHGCPFRFKDEGAFRAMLLKEQLNPLGGDYAPVRPTAGDIEDIVQDCKGQHYTRACYKYFLATHPGAKRDTLFRSPFEYYSASCEMSDKAEEIASAQATPSRRQVGGDNFKRSLFTPTLKEDVIRPRH